MQIKPISSNKSYFYEKSHKSASYASMVNFNGGKQSLVAISTNDFKTNTAKKLYSAIHKFFQIVGDSGNIEEVKILSENLEFYNKYKTEKFTTNVDTLMSIQKNVDKAILKLYRQYPSKKKHCVFEAEFDKDGKMVQGQYNIAHLKFERGNDNIRRIKLGDTTLLPHGYNDREWGLDPRILPALHRSGDNSTRGMYEIFIELARLYTTMYK